MSMCLSPGPLLFDQELILPEGGKWLTSTVFFVCATSRVTQFGLGQNISAAIGGISMEFGEDIHCCYVEEATGNFRAPIRVPGGINVLSLLLRRCSSKMPVKMWLCPWLI